MKPMDAELTKLADTVEPLEVKSLGDGTLLLKGIAATFGPELDRQDERFDAASFKRAWERFVNGPAPVVCLNHRLGDLLGRIVSHRYVGDAVEVEVEVPKPADGAPALQNAYRLARAGLLSGFSVGGKWARKIIGGETVLFAKELVELSLAPVPASRRTYFTLNGVKSMPDLGGELAKLEELTAGPTPLDDALGKLEL